MTRLLYVLGSGKEMLGLANWGQKLYHQTTAIRPKLIRLIEKYSQKKGTLHIVCSASRITY